MKIHIKNVVLIAVPLLIIAFLISVIATPTSGISKEEVIRTELSASDISQAAQLSQEYSCERLDGFVNAACFELSDGAQMLSDNRVLLSEGGELSFEIEAPADGEYYIAAKINIQNEKPTESDIDVICGGKSYKAILPTLWADVSKTYPQDRFGNETVPGQWKLNEDVFGVLRLKTSPFNEKLKLELKKGLNKITMSSPSDSVMITAVGIAAVEELPAYSEYSSANAADAGTDEIIIEGEGYAVKSDSYITASSASNASLYPYNIDYSLINILDGSSGSESGESVTYLFEIESAGEYSIGFRYAQTGTEDMSCFKKILIDGVTPFKELESTAFDYTSFGYEGKYLSDESGNPYRIYLNAGKHTLTIETTVEPYIPEINRLGALMTKIRDLSLDVKKVTANSTDKYRTWNMEEFIPGISDELYGMEAEIESIYDAIEEKCGKTPSFASTLNVAAANLRTLAEEPDKLPNNMELFSDGTSSVSQRLATVSDALLNQAVDIDRIYISGSAKKLEPAKTNFLTTCKNMVMSFIHSFSGEVQGYSGAKGRNDEALVVWVNRPIQYVTLLQQLTDSDFTEKTGIDVEIYIMPNESKLVLSNASGSNPDVAMSVSNQTPFNLALRGAAYPLSEFDDFYEYLSEDYNIASYSGLVLDGKVYGTVETSDFWVMAYRKDILDSFGIAVPDTWEDVISIMPKLKRYGMNFYTPIAGNKGTKYFHETTPYLFQAGAQLLASDGAKVDFTSEASYKGFEMMTELYQKYSLSQDTPNFYNNFRYGTVPIGIINYSTYILLENAAPELAGQWEITHVPGVMDENGEIHRYQVAGDKCDLVFNNSEKNDEAWKFLKWWLSEETQSEYANLLMTRYGPEYFWNTSNINAFEQLPMDQEDIETIVTQWREQTKEIQKHPAAYMIEREISNVWTAVVVNGADLRTTLVQSETTVNREIELKLTEFGYMRGGEIVKDYTVLSDEELFRIFTEEGKK